MALGALKSNVMRGVLANGMRPVLIGLAIGMTSTVAISGAFSHVLYGVSPPTLSPSAASSSFCC